MAPVYTSDPASPRRPQDSVPACPLRLWPDETFTHRHSSAWHDVLPIVDINSILTMLASAALAAVRSFARLVLAKRSRSRFAADPTVRLGPTSLRARCPTGGHRSPNIKPDRAQGLFGCRLPTHPLRMSFSSKIATSHTRHVKSCEA